MNNLGNSIKIQNNENNENNPNNAIKAEEPVPNEDTFIDEKVILAEKLSLLPSDKNEIITSIQKKLQKINMQKISIENISSNICDKIYKYRILIIEDLFQLIYGINHYNPKVEYLCLINDILSHNFGLDKNEKDYDKIFDLLKYKFFPFIKEICCDLCFGLEKYCQDAVKFYINEWEKNNYYESKYIKEIKFELKMRNDPEISGSKQEINFLKNLVNNSGFKIEQNLIDFSRQYEALNRNKDNKQRKQMLKMEKELIQKQMKMYQIHIQQLKDLNLLISKIKECNLSENNH